ncbi:MAG: von Willebrand factor type A domain-containing protein [Pirellulaceae bacterium]|nr:von Willebrand factor type A domain-containing protein [Planctomycetales bacterium]
MNEEHNHHPVDSQLEARLVALVLGEASDFEREQLLRLVAERSDVAALYEELRSLHELMRDVSQDDISGRDKSWTEWKLPVDRRNQLFRVFAGDVDQAAATLDTVKPSDRSLRTRFLSRPLFLSRGLFWKLASSAAVLGIAVVLTGLMLPSVNSYRLGSSASHDGSETMFFENSERLERGRESVGKVVELSSRAAEEQTLSEDAQRWGRSVRTLDDSKSTDGASRDSMRDYRATLDSLHSTLGTDFPANTNGTQDSDQETNTRRGRGGAVRYSVEFEERAKERGEDVQRTPEKAGQGGAFSSDGRGRSTEVWLDDSSFPEVTEAPMLPAVERENRGQGGYAWEGEKSAPQTDSGALFGGGAGGFGGGGAGNDEFGGASFGRGGFGGRDRFFGDTAGAGEAVEDRSRNGEAEGRPGADAVKDLPVYAEGVDSIAVEADQNGDGAVGNSDFALPVAPPADPASRSSSTFALDATDDYGESTIADTESRQRQFDGQQGGEQQQQEQQNGQSPSELDTPILSFSDSGRLPEPETGPVSVNGPDASSLGVDVSDGDAVSEIRLQQMSPSDEAEKKLSNLHQQLDRFDSPSTSPENQFESNLEQSGQDPRLSVTRKAERLDAYIASGLVPTVDKKKLAVPEGLAEVVAGTEPFSTFSLHVSDVSFKLAQAALAGGQWPDAAKIRIEEFVNAFDYGDPLPTSSEKVSCVLEQCIHPFLQQRNMLRIAVRTSAIGRSSSTPLRITFLLDNSGSMERADRRQTVRRAFAMLAQQLNANDQVTLISFARQPRLLADKVAGDRGAELLNIVEQLPSEGGTNFEAALQLAYQKAREQLTEDAQNRIILLTDGAVNLGDADPESLSRMVVTMREEHISFDAAGISAEGLNDEVLEALTRQGDGRYYLLDSAESVDDGFVRQIAAALRPSAMNVKVQVQFNPQRVGKYKLLGFEKHTLKQEDFRNDKVDAAELAAAEAGVAMYQFEAQPDGSGDVGTVSVRFLDLTTGHMVEKTWPIPYQPQAPRPEHAPPSIRLATSAALFAAKMHEEALGETVDLATLSDLVASVSGPLRRSLRVQQLEQMLQQARQIIGR